MCVSSREPGGGDKEKKRATDRVRAMRLCVCGSGFREQAAMTTQTKRMATNDVRE